VTGGRLPARSKAELAVLVALLREGPQDATNVAHRSFRYLPDPLWRDRYDAISRCIEQGLVRVLTAADAAADALRWQGDQDEVCSSERYEKGFVDLTEKGIAVLRREVGGLRGDLVGLRRRGATHHTIITTRKATLLRWLRDERKASEQAGLVIGIDGPRRVGRWWLHRLLALPRGWRADVRRRGRRTEESRRALAILTRHRITVAEFWVLRSAYDRLGHSGLADHAVWKGELDPMGSFDLPEAARAEERLCARRLLQVSTRFGEPFRTCHPGRIELTRLGTRLLVLLEGQIAAASGGTRFDGVVWKEHVPSGDRRLRAVRREDLVRAIENPMKHARRGATAVHVGTIRPGGPHRPHPYDFVPATWVVDLELELPPHPPDVRAAEAGLSEFEYSVIASISQLPPVDRHWVASHAKQVAMRGTHPEYAAAIDSLLGRGLIKLLTRADCEQDAARWATDDQHTCGDDPYREGRLVFTAGGAALQRSIFDPDGSGEWRNRIHFRRISEDRMAYFSQDPDLLRRTLLTGRGEHGNTLPAVREMVGPYPVSHCWIDRFTRLDNVYRADVVHEPETGAGER